MKNILALILGGGQGTRLFPLTKDRSKPAVPIGGKYRLIDIPISNCLNSDINQIYILTQFNSASLNKHINQTYRFDNFHRGFVDILAAEQSIDNRDWYQGTADAVRKNLKHILAFYDISHVLILSGDQIYKMDFRQLFDFHKNLSADLSIPVLPVSREEAGGFGIVKVEDNIITQFVEKPKEADVLNKMSSADMIAKTFPNVKDKPFLASMGIYLFNIKILLDALDTNFTDFGKDIIPTLIKNVKVGGFLYNDYWEDVGTIKSFLKANLELARWKPKTEQQFDFYNAQIYTHARYLPASKINHCDLDNSLVADGSEIINAVLRNSIIGVRSIIGQNVTIENSYIMGADYYEDLQGLEYNKAHGVINIGIGDGCIIKNAIIDKNARIGEHCVLTNEKNLDNCDGDGWYIRDGIIIVPKNAVIKPGTKV